MTQKNKKLILIFGILAIFFGLVLSYIFIRNLIKPHYEINVQIYETAYENIEVNNQNNILLATNENKNIVINLDNDLVDDNVNNGLINILYDDYYTITKDNISVLKRYNNEIINISTIKDYYELYKDEKDKNSKYISPYYDSVINDYSPKYKVAYYERKKEAFLYNAENGVILAKNANEIVPVLMNNELKFYYVTTKNQNYLFNIENEELIDLGTNKLKSDTIRNDYGDMIFYSSRYLVVTNQNNLTGLINLKGELIIPFLYADIFFKDDREDYIVAKNIESQYGVINLSNVTKVPFTYDGLIIDNDYIMLLEGNRIGIMDKNLQIINDFLIPYDSSSFIPRETDNIKNTFKYSFKSGNLIISSIVLKDYNTYIISPYGNIAYILGEKEHIAASDLNNEYYIITENYENDYLFLKIYDAAGQLINIYNKNNSKDITSVSIAIVSKDTIKVNYSDEQNDFISSEIINVKNVSVIAEDNSHRYGIITNITTGYYEKRASELNIYNKSNNYLDTIAGDEIRYLKDNKYILKKDNYWYLLKMDI